MTRIRFMPFAALALVAAVQAPLRAQGSGQSIQLAFGYECGDRFLVRNEGTAPVVLEYAPAGSQDRSQLHLNAGQSAEVASAQTENLELWVNGKVVASEPKGNRPCGAAPNGGRVAVRPIEPNAAETTPQPVDSGYSQPPVVVYAPPAYDYYPYAYYPYPYYPRMYFGFSPFFYPSISIYSRGGFGRGPVFRGRGRR